MDEPSQSCSQARRHFLVGYRDEYAAELKIEAQKLGFITRSWVVWYYTFGVHCKTKFARSHAHLFYFIKDREHYTFNREAISIPSARQLVYKDSRSNPEGRVPDDTWILRPQDCPGGFNAEEDTWYFPRIAGTFKERAGFHGCQMPEQLLGRIIRACSKPNEIVLDPFSGSSTTVVVAKKLDRRFLSFELSEDYAKRGMERLAAVSVGDRLKGRKTKSFRPLDGRSSSSTTQASGSKKANQSDKTTFQPHRGRRIGVASP